MPRTTKHCKIPTFMQTAVRCTSRTIGRNVCNALADHDPVLIDINDDLLSTRSCSALRTWDRNPWIYTEPSPRGVCTTFSELPYYISSEGIEPRYTRCCPGLIILHAIGHDTAIVSRMPTGIPILKRQLISKCCLCFHPRNRNGQKHTYGPFTKRSKRVLGGLCMDMLRLAWRT